MEKTVVCLKWGNRPYTSKWVNRLYRGVARNLAPPFNFVCFADETAGFEPAIEVRDINTLALAPHQSGVWWKLSLMHPVADLQGRCLFIDLDSAITGALDDFFTLTDRFYIVRNWVERRKQILRPRPLSGQSTTFLFEAGRESHAVEKYLENPQYATNRKIFTNPQAFLTHAVGLENITWMPEEFVRSYKRHCLPIYPLNKFLTPKIPRGCRILAFHGRPNPDDVIAGVNCGGRKHSLPMPILAEHWK